MKTEIVGYCSKEDAEKAPLEMGQEVVEKSLFSKGDFSKEKTEKFSHKIHIMFAVDEDVVIISKSEYDRLQEESNWLGDLEAAGIDNTTAYEEACGIRRERLGDKEEED
jgi:PHD/YefM family antitoxin component YafN of YafNO toxin-antitoxin module